MNATAATASAHDAPGGGIDSLIAFLRARGFPVGPSEALDAARLIAHLARDASSTLDAPDPARLIPKLRPVLCKRVEDQARFDAAFRDWAATRVPYVANEAGAAVPSAAPPAASVRRVEVWIVLAAIVLLPLFVWWNSTRHPDAAPSPPTVQQDNPAAIAPPWSGATRAPRVSSRFEGYYPAVRYNPELRPWVAAGLLGLGALGLLGLSLPVAAPWLGHARRSGRHVPLDLTSLRDEARRIVPPLSADIQARLERHIPGPAEARLRLQRRPPLHVGRTIDATLRRLGVLSLRHRDARLRPSYLLLIEVDSKAGQDPRRLVSDPRGRMFYHWAERLRKRGIEVDIRLARFDADAGTALTCRPAGTGWQLDGDEGEPLDRLPRPPVGQRLVVVSDGSLLIDEKDRWRDWARRACFHRWPQRVVFTPTEPRHWGTREDVLEERERPTDPGFYVLPLDEPALAAWADLLVTGRLPRFTLSRSQRYPAKLRALEATNQGDALLDPDTPVEGLAELLDQLRHYLGENGYYWLCACAVAPIVRWELTLLLGEQYYLNARLPPAELPGYIAHDYPRLAMLPWLRRQYMPDWLRLALLDSLSPRIQEEVREVVCGRLGQIRPDARGDDVLSLEAPPDPLGRARAPDGDADTLYLGFLAGHTPRQLMLRAPREWSGWLARLPLRQRSGLWREWLSAWRDRLLWRRGLSFFGASRRATELAAGLLALVAGLAASTAMTDPQLLPPGLRKALYMLQGRWIGSAQNAPISALAYRAADQAIVSLDRNGALRQWDTRTGAPLGPPVQELWRSSGDRSVGWRGAVDSMSRDGKRGATGNRDGSLWIWDTIVPQPGGMQAELGGTPVASVAFSPDGSMLASGHDDGTIRLWNTETAKMARGPLQNASEAATALAFSADGTRIVAGNAAGVLQQWDVGAGRPLGPPIKGLVGRITSTAFSPDGAYILAGGADGDTRLIAAATGDAIGPPLSGHKGAVTSLVFNPPGTEIVSGGEDGTVRFWDPRVWNTVRPGEPALVALGGDGRMNRAVFAPDGKTVLTAGADGNARLWDALDGKPLGVPMTHKGAVLDAVFSPDGTLVATASADGTARLWDAASGQPRSAALHHRGAVRSVRFSPDSQRLVSAGADSTARVWDRSGGAVAELPHEAAVNLALFGPDGSTIATASDDGTARLWPIDDQAFRSVLRISDDARRAAGLRRASRALTHRAAVLDLAFSPDGQRIVTACADTTAGLWRVADGSRILTLAHVDPVGHAAFSPDGTRIVTAAKNIAQLWNAASGEALGTAMEHDAPVRAASFSPDGAQILTASLRLDGAARLWDGHTGVPLGPSLAHPFVVWSAAFSPDGEHIVTAWGSDQPLSSGAATGQQQQQKQSPPAQNAKDVPAVTTTSSTPATNGTLPSTSTTLDPNSVEALKSSVLGKAIEAARRAIEGKAASLADGTATLSQVAPDVLGGAMVWPVPPHPLPLRPSSPAPDAWILATLFALPVMLILPILRRRSRTRQLDRWIAEAQT